MALPIRIVKVGAQASVPRTAAPAARDCSSACWQQPRCLQATTLRPRSACRRHKSWPRIQVRCRAALPCSASVLRGWQLHRVARQCRFSPRPSPAAHPPRCPPTCPATVEGIEATPYVDNLRHFDVSVQGPPDSPYAGGTFKLELYLPEDYPMSPPKVRFLTKIYHVNVDRLGRYVQLHPPSPWPAAQPPPATASSAQHLPGHPQGQVVPRAADPHSAAVHPGPHELAQPR